MNIKTIRNYFYIQYNQQKISKMYAITRDKNIYMRCRESNTGKSDYETEMVTLPYQRDLF